MNDILYYQFHNDLFELLIDYPEEVLENDNTNCGDGSEQVNREQWKTALESPGRYELF